MGVSSVAGRKGPINQMLDTLFPTPRQRPEAVRVGASPKPDTLLMFSFFHCVVPSVRLYCGPMLQQVHFWIRMAAYVIGIAAVLLILSGRERAYQAGYLLLLVMFVLFCASYVLYAFIRRKR